MVRFFEPSDEWLDWVAAYAAYRPVLDLGCGDGHIVRALRDCHVKVMGVDSRYLWEEMSFDLMSCVMARDARELRLLRDLPNALVLFCRPDHGGWVAETIRQIHHTSEVLYISKPCNVRLDIWDFDFKKLMTPPCPEEHVYQVELPQAQRRAS